MLTMTPPGSWKVWGEKLRGLLLQGWVDNKEGARSKLRRLSGLSWATAASFFGPGNNPWAKIARLATQRSVHLDMCRGPADDAVSKLHPGLRVVGT